jgi:hypothetical protein
VSGNLVFCARGYGWGYALLELAPQKAGGIEVKERYFQRSPLPAWHETTLLVDGRVYLSLVGKMMCLELETGEVLWEKAGAGGNLSVTCADGHLYLRSQAGKVVLIEASSGGYVLKGALQVPDSQQKPGSTAPVVAGAGSTCATTTAYSATTFRRGPRPRRDGSPRRP